MGAAAWVTTPPAIPIIARPQGGPALWSVAAISSSTAPWPTGIADPFDHPYKQALTEILGEPLKPDQLWNPDAVLRVEDIHHRPDTKDRLDKAAATQLVFEDALIHVVDHLLRATGASRRPDRRRGAERGRQHAAAGHFDEAWFAKAQQRKARLHLWVLPIPAIPASPLARPGCSPISPAHRAAHRGRTRSIAAPPPSQRRYRRRSRPTTSPRNGSATSRRWRAATPSPTSWRSWWRRAASSRCIRALAATRPRALGHRSIFANPCDPADTRAAERTCQIPRGDPPAGADGDAGSGA